MSAKEIKPSEAVVEELPKYDAIVDVRTIDERMGELGSVPLSLHVLLDNIVAGQHLPEDIPKDANILMICRSGGRSGKACVSLASYGYTNITNLVGGTSEWVNQGLPSVNVPKAMAEFESSKEIKSPQDARDAIIETYVKYTDKSSDEAKKIATQCLKLVGSDYENPTVEALEPFITRLAMSVKNEISIEQIASFSSEALTFVQKLM